MTLIVAKPGLQTIVQAAPFRGYRHLGMPAAGPADPLAHALANAMVGNAAYSAALEIPYGDAAFTADRNVTVAIAGARGSISVDGIESEQERAIVLTQGQTLHVGRATSGFRRYLAVAGGFAVDPVMGSRSTYLPAALGGFAGRALQAGDVLPVEPSATLVPEQSDWPPLHYGDSYILRIVIGTEAEWLTDGIEALGGASFTIGRRADRMGLRLEGAELSLDGDRRLASSAVFPGTIQCPPDGAPFLLGPDAQTTGGYPRIAQMTRADRHLIGQLKSGDSLRLVPVQPERARQIYREKLAQWRALIPDLRLD